MHILLVEDNESTARSVKLILAGLGHNVTHTASGEESVELQGDLRDRVRDHLQKKGYVVKG